MFHIREVGAYEGESMGLRVGSRLAARQCG